MDLWGLSSRGADIFGNELINYCVINDYTAIFFIHSKLEMLFQLQMIICLFIIK